MLPESQNTTPPAGVSTPPTTVDRRFVRPARGHLPARPEVHAACAAAHQPAVPHVGRARLQRDLQLRLRDIRMRLYEQRTPPVTTAADMLVPLRCM